MTEEPFYVFVRGQGWIPEPDAETYTGTTRKGERITLIKRAPKIGERGWWVNHNHTLVQAFDWDFMDGNLGWHCTKTEWSEAYHNGSYLVTVVMEGT